MKSPLALVALAAGVIGVGVAGYLIGSQRSDDAGFSPMAAAAQETAPAMSPAPMMEPSAGVSLTDAQQREVEAIIRNYLIANPEIIRDAINELQRKEDAAAQMAQAQAITDNAAALFSSPTDVVFGNPDGDVTLVEFFDYNCGYCRRGHADMQALLKSDPNLRVVMKEFPILSEGSLQASQVAVAVTQIAPDKYVEFHDALLTEPGQVDGPRALALAEEMGLDVEALKARLDSDEVQATISESHALAQMLNVTGTPSYVTTQEVIVGAVGYDALKASVEQVRAACAADSANC